MLIDGLISILNNVKKKSKREEFRIKYGIDENDNEYSSNDDNNKNNYYISNNNNDNIYNSDSNTNCKNDNNDDNDNDNYNRHKSNNLNNITIKEICQCIIKYLFDESLLQNNEKKDKIEKKERNEKEEKTEEENEKKVKNVFFANIIREVSFLSKKSFYDNF